MLRILARNVRSTVRMMARCEPPAWLPQDLAASASSQQTAAPFPRCFASAPVLADARTEADAHSTSLIRDFAIIAHGKLHTVLRSRRPCVRSTHPPRTVFCALSRPRQDDAYGQADARVRRRVVRRGRGRRAHGSRARLAQPGTGARYHYPSQVHIHGVARTHAERGGYARCVSHERLPPRAAAQHHLLALQVTRTLAARWSACSAWWTAPFCWLTLQRRAKNHTTRVRERLGRGSHLPLSPPAFAHL